MNARLLVVDDHQVVRQGVRDIVARDPALQVVAEAADAEQAEALVHQQVLDLLLLDLSLPGRNGLQLLAALRQGGVPLPALVFSMLPALPYAALARRAGAQGFVGKDAPATELLQAIHRVLDGGTWFAPGRRRAAAQAPGLAGLSVRETEVLHGLLAGQSLRQIGQSLGIGATSVTTYRRRLLDKLGVESNAELVALAQRLDRA